MIYIDNSKVYMKVWDIKPLEKYTDLRATTSEKKEDGSYLNSSWFPRCIGHAHNKTKELAKGDTILVTRFKLTNEPYEKDGVKRSFFRMLVLDYEVSKRADGQTGKQTVKKAEQQQKQEESASEEDMPF